MKSMINQVNKLRISFYAKEGNEVSFLGMYKKLGFEKEAELKDEYENKSLFCTACSYKSTFNNVKYR